MPNEMETSLAKQSLIDNSSAGGTTAAEARAEASFQKWLKWAEDAGAQYDANQVRAAILWATRAVKAAKHAAWLVELEKKNEVIRSAILDKTTPPDNYWKAEHHAWTVYESASKMLAAIEEELKIK